ncbi:hypothetical protein [Gordonia sp. (in: high G+C Gram-positive bacteria)]|uniref:hypothetical protein n=1 Tax=Gordonia sp. (in: high G+C Gram-positive bacteria) TaxID=84139 RepID=UPI001DE0F308|nr:hypothetical protein [Gordonia sp. (in: high G+C Gram-positive bacteria)]MCB1296478.1 hypothetical protein [Gordonia sp. (in: high G+C Gram-positive bacteria)]HMS74309.1 hypothetical protein [Gordonia sp. (in: high G+C Gram-positive bacteria)]HQV19153.1 hypothetical protein [Gordonia sp. (in: high G+C Gram-positive bacteria)]
MRVAHHIDDIGRRAGEAVTAALRDYTDRRTRLTEQARPSWTAAESVIRDRLQREADLADYGSPQVLLPADVASASPHTRRL